MLRRIVPWLSVIVLAVGLFWASSQANLRFAQDETEDFLIRKAGHVAVYALGTLLLWRALAHTTRLRPAWAWAAGIAVPFAASDELHQVFTQGREPTIWDLAIDAVGLRRQWPAVSSPAESGSSAGQTETVRASRRPLGEGP